jgi:hypothetical protein
MIGNRPINQPSQLRKALNKNLTERSQKYEVIEYEKYKSQIGPSFHQGETLPKPHLNTGSSNKYVNRGKFHCLEIRLFHA